MTKIVDVKKLQGAGLLGVEYTDLDLLDAFLMYYITDNTSNKGCVVLRDGNKELDIDSYFRKGFYSFYQSNGL